MKLQNTLWHPKHSPLSSRNSLDYSKALVRQSEGHLSCQRMSGETLGEMRVSKDVCWVSGMFKSLCSCLWQCLGYVMGDIWVYGDIWGCLGVSMRSWRVKVGWGGCLVVFPLQFPSILGSHKLDPWHFAVVQEVPNVSYIKMSQSYGCFELLGSLGRDFRAEL